MKHHDANFFITGGGTSDEKVGIKTDLGFQCMLYGVIKSQWVKSGANELLKLQAVMLLAFCM